MIKAYQYGTNAFKVRKSEMMTVRNLFAKKYVDSLFYDEVILKRQK